MDSNLVPVQTAANTRVERVVEGMESLANAIVDARNVQPRATKALVEKAQADVLNARQELRDGLREFMRPMLRAIAGSRVYDPSWTEADKVTCPKCQKQTPCGISCGDWAEGVRNALGAKKSAADDTPPEAA